MSSPSPSPSPYTDAKDADGPPSKLSKLQGPLKIFITLIAIAISSAAIYKVIQSMGAKAEADTATLNEYPHGTLSELTDPALFTTTYMSVNSNAELFEGTQTIRVSGHMIRGDNTYPFNVIKKRPDKMLFTTDFGSHEVTFGVSGNAVWQRVRSPRLKEDVFTLIEGPEAEPWLEQRRFFDQIISASLGKGKITEITVANWEETDCLKVAILGTNGASTEILVDPQTMYAIAELRTLPDGTTQQTVFNDYRIVDGMPVPFKVETLIDGNATSQIIVDSASLNAGVLSKIFETPKELLEK